MLLIFQKFTSTWSRLESDDIGTHTFPLMEGEWSLRSPVYRKENGHDTEVTLMEGEMSSVRGGQFNGGRILMLCRWPV